MTDLLRLLFGPLSGLECRRTGCRRWVFVARTASALVAAGVVGIWAWTWWFFSLLDPASPPRTMLPAMLASLESVLVLVALVLSPSLLAGAIAGEKDHGSLALLLASRLSSYEIVAGRLWPPLAQVGLILAAALPPMVLLAAFNGVSAASLATMVVLPGAVGLGSGGLALLTSALSRRGRDALMAVYLLELLGVLAPLLGAGWMQAAGTVWLGAVNPFHGVGDLSWFGQPDKAWRSAGVWTLLGTLCTAATAWRLRPLALRQTGSPSRSFRQHRGGRIPAVDERRPVLWKELYIERAGTLGRAGRWLGWTISMALLGSAVTLTALRLWEAWRGPVPVGFPALSWALGQGISGSALPLSWLLQWAIGLRAAVAVASERERHTWDALLATPLSGADIVWPKVWGSLYALRGLVAAVLIAWSLAALCGAMDFATYSTRVVGTVAVGWFTAAVGVRLSLSAATANRAMAQTIAVWLGAAVAVATVASIVALMIALIFTVAWQLLVQTPFAGAGAFPLSFATAWILLRLALYVLLGSLITLQTRARFNDLAGRLPLRHRPVPYFRSKQAHSM